MHCRHWADRCKQGGVGTGSSRRLRHPVASSGTRAFLASVAEKKRKNRRPESNFPYRLIFREVLGVTSPVVYKSLRSSTPNSGIFGLFSRIFHFFSVIFHTNTGKWVSEIVKAFDIFDMRLVTTCAHASCISSQGDVAAPDIFA